MDVIKHFVPVPSKSSMKTYDEDQAITWVYLLFPLI